MPDLLPLFLNVAGRDVLLVGGGPVAESKLQQLLAAGAHVRVVSPSVTDGLAGSGVPVQLKPFEPADLDGAWLVVAAAVPDVNRQVASAAEARRLFVNAVDDPPNATAYLSGVVRRDGMTLAISTSGQAPALTGLLREGLDALLPRDLDRWMQEAATHRAAWKRDGVPMGERRPLLLQAINRLYDPPAAAAAPGGVARASGPPPRRAGDANPPMGHVSLVGAGPGDPSLLTRKAVARLRAADLVLYDALLDERILRYARRAQRFFVGKRAGRHAMAQETLHAVMIRAARRGRRVVRLQGGDPFLFGRGGEEAQALAHAGVPFDVVPGVTSAVAAPALAGMPVTHRGVASACLIVAGHDVERFSASLDGVPRAGLTLVVLMGVGRAPALASALLERGWTGETAAAIVYDASRPSQRVWRGSLRDLARGAAAGDAEGPGTLVIGDVARFALVSPTRDAARTAGVDSAGEVIPATQERRDEHDRAGQWGSARTMTRAPRGH